MSLSDDVFTPAGKVDGRKLLRRERLRKQARRLLKPPWRRARKTKLTPALLSRWRKFAQVAAEAKGARRACGLCKRGIMGLAKVTVSPPWQSNTARERWLCSECWKDVVWWLEDQEHERDGYDSPVDPVAVGITKGGKRGSFLKR